MPVQRKARYANEAYVNSAYGMRHFVDSFYDDFLPSNAASPTFAAADSLPPPLLSLRSGPDPVVSLMPAAALNIACVCASNQNRSCEAHRALLDAGYARVWSYGTGSKCRLPGKTRETANVYDFGTPYEEIAADLRAQDEAFYIDNLILPMLERNATIKKSPQKWQAEVSVQFDLVICYETRVFDAMLEDLMTRPSVDFRPCHIIGMHVKDNRTEAAAGARDTLDLVRLIGEAGDDWENSFDSILATFQQKCGRPIMHHVWFY